MVERRREKRLKVELPVSLSYLDNPLIYARTQNISRLGSYIEIEQDIPLGVKLDITIEIPAYSNDQSLIGSLKCQVDVFRCSLLREAQPGKVYGLGVFFTVFSEPQDQNKLSKYIDFLIVKEQEDVKRAMQSWREKRKKKH
ncbi:MAG: PilZ domain-containing protein [Candidatus Omnitrophota bacterium]